ncbi:MAG: hypothetical protein KDC34_13770 [Saprospiraceae bacterium]|nr:hypothetical protein [Saprospiraceae bacterium]
MKTNEINKLLDRYYAGETTIEEERTLKAYFSGNEVAPELQQHQGLFQSLRGMKAETLSADFEAKLLQKLQEKPQARVVPMRQYLLRIAAAVVLGFGLWFMYPKAPTVSEPQAIDWTAYENGLTEEEAMEETIAALRLLSQKLNSGKKKVKTEIVNMDRMKDPIH